MTKNITLYLFLIFFGYVLFNLTNSNLTNSNLTNSNSMVLISPNFTEYMDQSFNPLNISKKNLPIYYSINLPFEDNLFNSFNSFNNFNNFNNISLKNLSLFKNILRKVELYTNKSKPPTIFNYVERPVKINKINMANIKILAHTVINLINKFANPTIQIKYVSTSNESYEETDKESKINFDLKINFFYSNSEKTSKISKSSKIFKSSKTSTMSTMYIQPEFIFNNLNQESINKLFSNSSTKTFTNNNLNKYLSKIIIVGSKSIGFLGGRNDNKKMRK